MPILKLIKKYQNACVLFVIKSIANCRWSNFKFRDDL